MTDFRRIQTTRIRTADPDLSRIQDNLNYIVGELKNIPILFGILLEGRLGAAGDLVLNHNLNRPIEGWLVIDKDKDVSFYKASSDNTTLTLTGSGEVDAKFWVF